MSLGLLMPACLRRERIESYLKKGQLFVEENEELDRKQTKFYNNVEKNLRSHLLRENLFSKRKKKKKKKKDTHTFRHRINAKPHRATAAHLKPDPRLPKRGPPKKKYHITEASHFRKSPKGYQAPIYSHEDRHEVRLRPPKLYVEKMKSPTCDDYEEDFVDEAEYPAETKKSGDITAYDTNGKLIKVRINYNEMLRSQIFKKIQGSLGHMKIKNFKIIIKMVMWARRAKARVKARHTAKRRQAKKTKGVVDLKKHGKGPVMMASRLANGIAARALGGAAKFSPHTGSKLANEWRKMLTDVRNDPTGQGNDGMYIAAL
jgi:hypothetical protein